jgi:hypothetical protein
LTSSPRWLANLVATQIREELVKLLKANKFCQLAACMANDDGHIHIVPMRGTIDERRYLFTRGENIFENCQRTTGIVGAPLFFSLSLFS